MSKFKVGDEVAIAAVVKITAIQPNNNGTVSYSTDRGISIHEKLLEQIEIPAKPTDRLMGREEPKRESLADVFAELEKPAPQPAHRFKVGDRVVTSYGVGYVKQVDNVNNDGMPYCIKYDFGCALWRRSGEAKAAPAPAPEPKHYSGKVFAVSSNIRPSIIDVRNGHVFEIKDGLLVGETRKYQLWNLVGNPIMSFKDFCNKWYSTNWQEVKE